MEETINEADFQAGSYKWFGDASSGKMADMGMAKRRQLVILLLLLVLSSGAAQNAATSPAEEFHVGVILDLGSLVGKVALTSVSLAVEDFYAACHNCSRKLVLHVRDSMGNDVQAASAGMCSAASHIHFTNRAELVFHFHTVRENQSCLD